MLKGSISATTRPPRPKEVEGESYFFVSEAEFDKLKADKLIEWARVHDHLYGTPRDFVDGQLGAGRDVVLNIDVQGGESVKKAFSEAVLIFILPPSSEELETRIRGRGTDLSAEIEKRMQNAYDEIKLAAKYDYIIVNDRLEEAVAAVLAIIQSERHRRIRHPDDFMKRFSPNR